MAGGFQVDSSALQRAAETLEVVGFKGVANSVVPPILVSSANAVRRHVRAEAAPHRRSGHMAGRIQYVKSGAGLGTVVKVRAGGPVAHLLEDGVRPHEIGLGKGAGQLGGSGQALTIRGSESVNSRWAGSGNASVRGAGGDVLAVRTEVHHPGNRAVPFFAHGVDAAGPEVQGILDAGADKLSQALASKVSQGLR